MYLIPLTDFEQFSVIIVTKNHTNFSQKQTLRIQKNDLPVLSHIKIADLNYSVLYLRARDCTYNEKKLYMANFCVVQRNNPHRLELLE